MVFRHKPYAKIQYFRFPLLIYLTYNSIKKYVIYPKYFVASLATTSPLIRLGGTPGPGTVS